MLACLAFKGVPRPEKGGDRGRPEKPPKGRRMIRRLLTRSPCALGLRWLSLRLAKRRQLGGGAPRICLCAARRRSGVMGGHAVFVPAYALPAIRSRAHPLRACGRSLVMPAWPCRAVPCHAEPCRALPCRAMPALPRRATPRQAPPCLPCPALPCLAAPCLAWPRLACLERAACHAARLDLPVTLSGIGKKPIACALESDRVNVSANHGAQQAVGQRRSALPRDCSPTNL